MQLDEDVGRIAKPALSLAGSALEHFVADLVGKSAVVAQQSKAGLLDRSHIKQCVESDALFDFLKGTVSNAAAAPPPKRRRSAPKPKAADALGLGGPATASHCDALSEPALHFADEYRPLQDCEDDYDAD